MRYFASLQSGKITNQTTKMGIVCALETSSSISMAPALHISDSDV